MSQVVLELSNREDLTLLLSLAKRLNAHVVSVKTNGEPMLENTRLAVMKQAANDPRFLADVVAVSDDFKHIDAEFPNGKKPVSN